MPLEGEYKRHLHGDISMVESLLTINITDTNIVLTIPEYGRNIGQCIIYTTMTTYTTAFVAISLF